MVRVGDLLPQASGSASLGVDGAGQPVNASFDITSIAPFNHIHQLSGVYHDPLLGQSGVIRFNMRAASGPCMELSVDGGLTFGCLATTDNVVTSVGVIGDANLTGNVDLASPASGFIAIFDTADASPINFAVDTLGLSGLYGFPTQGFNGRVVNALTDFHGTEAQGVVNVVGASGILVDIVGQTMTITNAAEQIRCYSETFSSSNTWNAAHGLGTEDVIVMAFDGTNFMFIPDKVEIVDSNTVEARHNVAVAGKLVIIACL